MTFAKAGDYKSAAEILNRDYNSYLDIIENGFTHFSELDPPTYLYDMQTNYTTVEIRRSKYSCFAGQILDSLANEFPEEFRQTAAYVEIVKKFESLTFN